MGFDIATTEDTAAWTAFLWSLVARRLSGVEMVISDAHDGIKTAIASVLAEVSWQRCRTHFTANDDTIPLLLSTLTEPTAIRGLRFTSLTNRAYSRATRRPSHRFNRPRER